MNLQPDNLRDVLTKVHGGEEKICPPLPGIPPDKAEPAAVLIPLIMEEGEWKLLFIKRTHQPEDRHSGQIAFPGGRADEQDKNLLNTALRESAEEIGIDPGDVEILGQSCPITTVTNYKISPFVGILPWPYPLRLSKVEVEKSFLIPLDWLKDPNNREEKIWQSRSRPGLDLPVIFFQEFAGEVLWGATAQMVVDFLELIDQAD
jgi:8-oxo-dGTP pyrophosphatase MutT (NUDIX family)